MPEDKNINELRKEFHTEKKEVSKLRSKLNGLNSEKETAFQEFKLLRDKIRGRAGRIKELKKERDELTKQVKELKEERDQFNNVIKEKSGKKKEVEEQKKKLFEQFGLTEDPGRIKTQINKLEEKLETEVMPFSKEESLRKTIKELKAKLKEAEKMGDAWKEVNTAAADFAESRRKAQDSHKEVQKKAQESQEKHEKLNALFEELKKLRAEEQPLAEKHLKFRAEFDQAKKELEDKQKRVNELAKLFSEEEEKSFNAKVKEKTTEVKEKIKQGKKLSTEDILAFQAINE